MFSNQSILAGSAVVGLIFSHGLLSAPVNVNIVAAEDIAEALEGVDIYLDSHIQMHCELNICRSAEDLKYLPGMTPELLNRIAPDLIFNILERGMDQNDDC